MTNKLTVSAKWIIKAADQIERDAQDSLQAWIILGQSDKYSQACRKARAMREAAQIKNIASRREMLREIGVDA